LRRFFAKGLAGARELDELLMRESGLELERTELGVLKIVLMWVTQSWPSGPPAPGGARKGMLSYLEVIMDQVRIRLIIIRIHHLFHSIPPSSMKI